MLIVDTKRNYKTPREVNKEKREEEAKYKLQGATIHGYQQKK